MVHVGVIGGGPAGLCVAHNALNAGHQVTLWEQCDQVGGTWVYSPKVGIHSSMYEVMKTNLPREGMSFPDTPFDTNLPSFLDHQHVLEYLQNYSRDIHEIQLNTKVMKVERKENIWEVKVQTNGEEKSHKVDALFVCNGHFFEPNRPFDERKFEGTIIHSHDYRNNRSYAGKRVIMIGHGFSGIDIGCQIAEVAEMVYLVGHCKNPYNGFPKNLILIEEDIEEILENGVRTKDGKVIECDEIIVSTGYFYSYPFLSKSIVQIEEDGRVVRPLYLHYIHRQFPRSLFFVGLNFIVVPFVLFHAQAQYALALIEGKCEVPSVEEMDKWEEKRLKALCDDDQPIRRYHMMGGYQWKYFDELAERCQSPTPFYTPLVRKLFDYTFNARRADVLNYKYVDFEVDGDEFKVKQR